MANVSKKYTNEYAIFCRVNLKKKITTIYMET